MTDAQTPTQATRAGNWRDVLTGSGSFRGVPFYVSGRQNQRGGRRIAKREFPLRENGGADDLGKSLREYSFKAVLLGTDYLSARDALITALDTPGAGELVHPNYGTISVQIATWECTENTRNGGSADFDITFYPPLDTTAPVSTADAAAATNAAADSATDSLLGDFGDNWDISSLSMNDIDALINNATSYVNEITSNIQQVFGVLDAAGDIMSSATALAGSISSLIYQPAAMIHKFSNLISSAGGLADTASGSFSTYKTMVDNLSLSDGTPPVIDSVDSEGNPEPVLVMPPTSPKGIVALQQFRSAIGQLIVCQQAASATVMLTESIRYTQQEQQTSRAVTQLLATEQTSMSEPLLQTRSDVAAVRQSVASDLDSAAATCSDYGWYNAEQSARTLRLTLIADLTSRGVQLPGLQEVVVTTTEPALTLLNRVGNVAMLGSFIRRNNVRNPLFLMPDRYEVSSE
ncbi:DNA circularization protein [Citrobacter braakii]|uniref:DNA circularization protein n=1 Tax=Citrobacter braakii TaxID=57706 RepID=UPI00403A492E